MTTPLKRLLLPLLMLLAIPAIPMSAQRHYIPHVHVGVHGGVSMSRQSFYPSIKEGMLNGLQFGLSFRYAEERHVGLLAELNIEQRGWKEDFEEDPFSFHRRLTYIELPIMTHIFFGSRTVKGFFNLGPEVGYMIGDKATANFPYTELPAVKGFPSNRRYEQMTMDISSRFDYGITAGAGVEFIIHRRNSITLEGRYYYGLGNIFPSARKDIFSASRGSSIQITLGYLFRLK
ncbi:MAG: PorT family protein [Muribaculaceae bacterium]|nr:PorT family protein [Muribaculaceae bacterium]